MRDTSHLVGDLPGVFAVRPEDVAAAARDTTVVVLDDDPTGTQSVSALPVLTRWQHEDLRWALRQGTPACYVLTNTRSLDQPTAVSRTREVVAATLTAARELGRRVGFVSRSDSTLRGHYPAETDALVDACTRNGEAGPDALLLVPAFPDAGRITVHGMHYHLVGPHAVPVGETEFARDATFGYRSSDLADWIEEKTSGAITADAVTRLDITTIRRGPDAVAEVVGRVTGGAPVVVDAVVEDDLRVVALGVALAERRGVRVVCRTGPSFVRARIGQPVAGPIPDAELPAPRAGAARGGLIVVGSHVELTTRQLGTLCTARPEIAMVEISAPEVIGGTGGDHIDRAAESVIRALGDGDVVLCTSRQVITGRSGQDSLAVSRRVSAAVVDVVRRVVAARLPRFVVAKGGITSSDVATDGLAIRRAVVRGTLLPGIVSLWQPVGGPVDGIPYVVFPGNVGDDGSLLEVVDRFAEGEPAAASAGYRAPTVDERT